MEVPILIPKYFNYPFTYLKKHNDENLNQGDLVLVHLEKKRNRCRLGRIKKNKKKN